MKRIAEIIDLKPECQEKYFALHKKIWPEIEALIYACNIRNYTIFYRNGQLFAYYEYIGDDFEADMKKMAEDPKNQEWWSVCKPCQSPLEDRKEGEWWASMEEVWHQD
ncbi:MAG TPA: L-rhamnose mutarotase [Firmicutes bacterium]|nr:L-rhamnose mutarotase [Bacillota bacterium]